MTDDADKTAPKPAPETVTETETEEVEISSDTLLTRVKAFAAEQHVRRLRIREPDGDVAVDIPLTVGAVAGGAVILAAPVLAILGVLAAMVSHVKVEIVRETPKE